MYVQWMKNTHSIQNCLAFQNVYIFIYMFLYIMVYVYKKSQSLKVEIINASSFDYNSIKLEN